MTEKQFEEVQKQAKVKIEKLLTEYDVVYIDYGAMDDEYSIKLGKEIPDLIEHPPGKKF